MTSIGRVSRLKHMFMQLTFSTASALQAIHGKGANVFKGDEFYGVLDGGPHGAKSVCTQMKLSHL